MRIVLSGSSGLIGRNLAQSLVAGGHQVKRLIRRETPNDSEIRWDPANRELDADALEGHDAIVHLGGSPIAVRWTEAQKKKIVQSRVDSTSLLATTIDKLSNKPTCFVVSSAVGYYGDRDDEELTESSGPGSGFLSTTCLNWEEASKCSVRTVNVRTGLVMAKDDQLLGRLTPIFKLGIGGPIGSGKQYMSWISLDDIVRAFEYAITNSAISGPINASAPNPVTNERFSRALAKELHRPCFMRVPAFALRAVYGQMADEALLAGQRVLPKKLLDSGFRFKHSHLAEALADVFR
jgi:uncharacterized protein (TIGR01777 family)